MNLEKDSLDSTLRNINDPTGMADQDLYKALTIGQDLVTQQHNTLDDNVLKNVLALSMEGIARKDEGIRRDYLLKMCYGNIGKSASILFTRTQDLEYALTSYNAFLSYEKEFDEPVKKVFALRNAIDIIKEARRIVDKRSNFSKQLTEKWYVAECKMYELLESSGNTRALPRWHRGEIAVYQYIATSDIKYAREADFYLKKFLEMADPVKDAINITSAQEHLTSISEHISKHSLTRDITKIGIVQERNGRSPKGKDFKLRSRKSGMQDQLQSIMKQYPQYKRFLVRYTHN